MAFDKEKSFGEARRYGSGERNGNDRKGRDNKRAFGGRTDVEYRKSSDGERGQKRGERVENDERPSRKASERDDLIIGRNAAKEALQSGRAIDSVLVANGEKTGDGSKGGKERGKEGRERSEMRKNTRKNPTKGDARAMLQ